MISKEILKKHNLKAVPFSCIGEGETFNDEESLNDAMANEYYFYAYRRKGDFVTFADSDGCSCARHHIGLFENTTVYVPVGRVTSETLTV